VNNENALQDLEEVNDVISRADLVEIHCNPKIVPQQVYSRIVSTSNSDDSCELDEGLFLQKDFLASDSYYSLDLSRIVKHQKISSTDVYKATIANADPASKHKVLKLILEDLELPSIYPDQEHNSETRATMTSPHENFSPVQSSYCTFRVVKNEQVSTSICDPSPTIQECEDHMQEIRELLRENAEGISEQIEAPLKTDRKININDIMEMMPFNAAASNERALEIYHIKRDENDLPKAYPLSNRAFGSVLQVHPTCHSNWIMDYGPIWMRNEKMRELQTKGHDVSLFVKREGVGLSSVEFVDDCFKCLLVSFLGRPQFINIYYTFIKHQDNHNEDSLPTPSQVNRLFEIFKILQAKKVNVSACFTAQYDVCPELNSFELFAKFVSEYSKIHRNLFPKEVIQKSISSNGFVDRRLFMDNWVEFAGSLVPQEGGKSNKFLFHVYKAMQAIEGAYGNVFGTETLRSVPIGYGAHQAWLNINRESFVTPLNREAIKKERVDIQLKARRKGTRSKPRYWDELMTETEANEFLNRLKSLEDWKLKCMLMKVDKSTGELVNIITNAPIGCYTIDVFYCEPYRVLRKMSRTYNISLRPFFDISYAHPFKHHHIVLQTRYDKRLFHFIQESSRLFQAMCGNSSKFCEIYKIPPDVFCTEIEVSAFRKHNRQMEFV
jgi:hypothetical protein